MTDRHRQQWETLGSEDPYWAVLSDPGKIGGKWDKPEFFRTGTEEIGELLTNVSRLGLTPRTGLALDYGCGVGRLSRALATSFHRVVGVDISASMLAEARAVNSDCDNLRFLLNNGRDLDGLEDGTVDFIYSNMVLQHSPKNSQRTIIREFCRVLKKDGILAFQAPSHQNLRTIGGLLHFLSGNLSTTLLTRIRHGRGHVMEMHPIKKQEVLEILRTEGMRIVDVEADDCAGTAFVSYRYFAVKN